MRTLQRRAALRASAFLAIFVFLFSAFGPALAQATTYLAGNVSAHNKPVVGATVTVLGNNLRLESKTDAQGHFVLSGIPVGTYNVDIAGTDGTAAMTVDVPSAGTTLTATLTPLKQIGRAAVTARPPEHGSGTDITLSSAEIAHSPASDSLPSLLLQMPGAARGANGVVHINGDHGVIGYIVDGAPLPQELNSIMGTEFDPNDIASMQVIEGAFPAQYGERFAAIMDIATKTGSGPPGFAGNVDYGSWGHADSTLSYHAPVGKGYLQVATRNEMGDRGEDPPNLDSPHNKFSNTDQFLRYTLPTGKNFLNLTVSNSYNTYQIPNDVNGGEPASTDDNETQSDFFSNLQFRHPISDHGELSIGAFYQRSQIRDFGDPQNDFTYGAALNAAGGGSPTACADGIVPNGSGGYTQDPNYTNASCGYSLSDNRTAVDVGGDLDYQNQSKHHTVAFGLLTDATHVAKDYNVTLQGSAQGGNFLTNSGLCPQGGPDGSCTVTDDAPNVGHLTAAYLQDSWKMSNHWQADYGIRQDFFSIASTQFDEGYAQTSPRLKLTYAFSPTANVYAYYGRLFMPYTLENVSPSAAYLLNLPLQSSPAAFDLKPERISDYEIGGHVAIGSSGDLGLRVMQQNSTDWIDDTQVGVTNLHQDVNYALGRIATQSLYYQLSLPGGNRFYASATHTYAVDKGCETQLLAPCFGATEDWAPADHDQRYDVSSGIVMNDRHGGWFSVDGEYGSGLSTDPAGVNPNFTGITCGGPNGNLGGPCKVPPHLTFDAEKGFGVGHGNAIVLRVQNLLNDQYMITYLNAQGNHWALPRSFDIGYRFGTSK